MKSSHVLTLLALAVQALAGLAQAQETANTPSPLSISGFGTLALSRLDTDQGVYLNDIRQRNGSTDHWSGEADSKFGLQGTFKLSNNISFTGQAQLKPNEKGQWAPSLEWLFAKAALSPEFEVRAGRVGVPFFMISDYREVGFANTWVRPPVEVYGQVPFNNADGVDLNYQSTWGSANVRAQFFLGQSESKLRSNVADYKLKGSTVLNASIELAPWTLRLGTSHSDMTAVDPTVDPLIAGLRQVGQIPGLEGIGELANRMDLTNKRVTFNAVGLTYDEGNVVAAAEYTTRNTNSYVADVQGWYASVGYRVGTFTPYITISRVKQTSPTTADAIPPAPSLAGLKAGADRVLRSAGQQSNTLGVRWDARSNLALKLQADFVHVEAQGINWRDATPALPDKTAKLITLSADFLF
jgi:hypothetical protein